MRGMLGALFSTPIESLHSASQLPTIETLILNSTAKVIAHSIASNNELGKIFIDYSLQGNSSGWTPLGITLDEWQSTFGERGLQIAAIETPLTKNLNQFHLATTFYIPTTTPYQHLH